SRVSQSGCTGEFAMRNRFVMAGCVAVLLFAGVIGGIGRLGAQLKEGANDKAADKRVAPVEGERCLISLVDDVTLAFGLPGIVDCIGPREGDSVVVGQFIAGVQEDVAKATLAIAAAEAESDVDVRYSEAASKVAQTEHEKALEANRAYPNSIT